MTCDRLSVTSCEQPKLQQDLSRLFPYHERARCFCWTAAVFSAPRLPVLNIGGRHVVLFQAPSLQRGWAGTCRPRGEAKQVLDLSQCSMLPRSANVSRSAVSCSGASPQPEIVPFAGGAKSCRTPQNHLSICGRCQAKEERCSDFNHLD